MKMTRAMQARLYFMRKKNRLAQQNKKAEREVEVFSSDFSEDFQ